MRLNFLPKSVKRHFGIQSGNFDSKHSDQVNQFMEDNFQCFYPSEDPDDPSPFKTLGSQGENFIVNYCGMYDSVLKIHLHMRL